MGDIIDLYERLNELEDRVTALEDNDEEDNEEDQEEELDNKDSL